LSFPAKQWQPWRQSRNSAPKKAPPIIILFVSSSRRRVFFLSCFFCFAFCVCDSFEKEEERIFFFDFCFFLCLHLSGVLQIDVFLRRTCSKETDHRLHSLDTTEEVIRRNGRG
jgi:hypothetical protein